MLRLNPNYETDFAPQLAKRRAALDAFDIASIATPAGPAVGPLRSDATAGLGRRQAEDRADYSHGGCRGCPRPLDWMLCMHRGYEYGYYWPEQNKPAEGDGDWSECLCHRYQADIPYTRRNIDYLMSVPGPATIEAGECQRVACMHNSGISWCNLVSLFFLFFFSQKEQTKKGGNTMADNRNRNDRATRAGPPPPAFPGLPTRRTPSCTTATRSGTMESGGLSEEPATTPAYRLMSSSRMLE